MVSTQQSTSCLWFALIFFSQTFIVFLFFRNISRYSSKVSEPPEKHDLSAEKEPELTILLWTWPFGNSFPLNQCPESLSASRCFYTANRSLYSSSDVVIFHHRDVCNSMKLMPQIPRPPGQYWVWFNLESPSQSPNLGMMDNLINLTMSYREDSDIFIPYGSLEEKNLTQKFIIPEKSHLVAWAVSNWNPQSKRVQYYHELKKYINIDIYGRQHIPLDMKSALDTFSKYKFYLAFENSQHKDYITEKLWNNALMSGSVPVVLGPPRENYERFIPRDSFIHVEDFVSAKELAAYLLKLDRDNQRYQQYFEWRSKFQVAVHAGFVKHYCKACKVLKKPPSSKIIPSLTTWFT
ncbi:4-galactosyl-N-acetylglucosaminide 3-alpha-L-fucosyltransferase FUT6-like [Discoglossus pictus]